MRSVVVVLPASMWAMIPMLRVRPRGNSRIRGASAIVAFQSLTSKWALRASRAQRELPAVVGERLVGLSHLVGVLPALHRRADPVGRVQQFIGQPLGHGLLPALTGVPDEPPDGQ